MVERKDQVVPLLSVIATLLEAVGEEDETQKGVLLARARAFDFADIDDTDNPNLALLAGVIVTLQEACNEEGQERVELLAQAASAVDDADLGLIAGLESLEDEITSALFFWHTNQYAMAGSALRTVLAKLEASDSHPKVDQNGDEGPAAQGDPPGDDQGGWHSYSPPPDPPAGQTVTIYESEVPPGTTRTTVSSFDLIGYFGITQANALYTVVVVVDDPEGEVAPIDEMDFDFARQTGEAHTADADQATGCTCLTGQNPESSGVNLRRPADTGINLAAPPFNLAATTPPYDEARGD